MLRIFKRGIKARLSFSGGLHAPVNIADSIEVNVGGKKRSKWHIRCAVLRSIPYAKFSQILEFAMFTGACGPPEKLSLALMPRLKILSMIVKLAHRTKMFA